MSRSLFFYLLSALFLSIPYSVDAADTLPGQPSSEAVSQAPTQTKNDTPKHSSYTPEQQDAIEHIRKEIVSQLDALYELVEDYGFDIAAGAIKVDNRDKEALAVMKLKQMIEQVKSIVYVDPTTSALLFGSHASKRFAQHLKDALSQGLAQTPVPSIESVRSFPIEGARSLNTVITDTAQINTLITQLQTLSRSRGLTWYNKLYRFCTDRIVQPAVDYKIAHIAGLAAIAGLVTTEVLFRSHSTHKTLRSWLGYPLHVDSTGRIDTVWHSGIDVIYDGRTGTVTQNFVGFERPALWLGKAEHYANLIAGAIIPAAVISVPFLKDTYQSWFASMKKYISKKASDLNEFLKGGMYKLRIDQMNTRKTFDNLIGHHHAKEIGRTLIKYLEDPERFSRKKLAPEKGYILYGKSRTGKSEFAKALSGEIHNAMAAKGNNSTPFSFFEVKTEDILQHGIQMIHDFATLHAPCVIFIDEIDLLGLQRVGGNPQMLSEFLSTMSGFVESDPKKQVIMIAATNKAENIDFALRQRGRFGKAIYFELPNLHHRLEYIAKRCADLCLPFDEKLLVHFAFNTEGATFEDLNAIIKSGIQRSKIEGIPFDEEQLERSLDEEFRGILFDHEHELSQDERVMRAAYLVGKASCMMLIKHPAIISKLTLLPVQKRLKEKLTVESFMEDSTKKSEDIIQHGALFTLDPRDGVTLSSLSYLELELMATLAGVTAQRILNNDVSTDLLAKDKQTAQSIALSIALQGAELEKLSKKTKEAMLTKAEEIVAAAEEKVATLLKEHMYRIRLAHAVLFKNSMLDGSLLNHILTSEKIVEGMDLADQLEQDVVGSDQP